MLGAWSYDELEEKEAERAIEIKVRCVLYGTVSQSFEFVEKVEKELRLKFKDSIVEVK